MYTSGEAARGLARSRVEVQISEFKAMKNRPVCYERRS